MEKIHDEYLAKMREISNLQESCQKALKHHNYLMKNVKDFVKKAEEEASTSEERKKEVGKVKEEMEVSRIKLRDMQAELPAQNNGFYLNLILGSNLNVSLLTKHERFNYKKEYEDFKWNITIAIAVLTIIAYFFSLRVVDSILCFLLVWYYCTLTIREAVLRVNGSRIKGWWMTHHYLSCALPGIILTWRDGDCYQMFRMRLLLFIFYISLVQLAQNQYQSGTLRRLHSLGEGHQMDITIEGFTSWQFKGLTFLLPFLMSGYLFQLYLVYSLYKAYISDSCDGEWQVWAMCLLFGVIALGNIYTTSLVILKKLRTEAAAYPRILALTRKYNSRTIMNNVSEDHHKNH
ncbi:unnamed protein product [Caenorhabditis auriculariae]|uniref:Transmembrane protein 120 homolog n=1 Tax=Caenorhabditis auriculariae TaxID=2777116 RepID=A0A8S1HQD8_9PELO|nr:unnamed protein product [Caenorhabditis auriculariae]